MFYYSTEYEDIEIEVEEEVEVPLTEEELAELTPGSVFEIQLKRI